MNSVFSVDELDALWHSPMMAETPEMPCPAAAGELGKMNRSSSEWALEQFIQEASGSPAPSASSVAGGEGGGPAIGPSATSPLSASSKPEEGGDEDVVEIKKPPPPSHPPAAQVDSDEYLAYLENRLRMACTAFAMSRATNGKPLGCTSSDEKEPLTSNPSKSGHEAHGLGDGFHKADVGSPDVPVLPAAQKKPGAQGTVTTSESSREQSDDDDLEGDTETTGNRYSTDDKRARRMQSNRESARRSRRRKQEHLTELEKQVSELRVENSTLSKRLNDVNQKYKDAAVDNRVLRADIETLRAKVKMAEDTVKRATGFNPLLQSAPDISSVRMPFVNRPSDVSTDQLFHQAVPSITSASRNQRLDSILSSNPPALPLNGLQNDVTRSNMGQTFPLRGVPGSEPLQKQMPVATALPRTLPSHDAASSGQK